MPVNALLSLSFSKTLRSFLEEVQTLQVSSALSVVCPGPFVL